MTTTTRDSVQEAAWVHPNAIIKIEGKNPRTTIDPLQLEQLEASIKQHGIFTPLLVRKNGEAYELVAGYRRLEAAQKIGLTEIPIAVINDKADDFQLAVTENLQREQFSLADEIRIVRAMLIEPKATHKKIAKTLNRSEQWVSQRASMAIGNDETMMVIDRGNIPGGHLMEMARLFGSQPAVFDAMVKALDYNVEQTGRIDSLNNFQPMRFMEYKLPDLADELLIEVFIHNMHSTSEKFLNLDSGDEEVNTLLDNAEHISSWERSKFGFEWTDEDIDAARSFGAVMEIPTIERVWNPETKQHDEETGEPDIFLIDREWMQSQLVSKKDVFKKGLKKWEKEQAKTAAVNPDKKQKPTSVNEAGEVVEESKEDKAKRIQKERKAAWKTNTTNHVVFVALCQKVGNIKPLAPEALQLWFEHRVEWGQLDRALVLLDDKYTVQEDSPKPKFVDAKDVDGAAQLWVNAPKKVEEKMQRVIGLIAAASIVDTSVIAQARRPQYSTYPLGKADLKKLVDKVFTPAQLKKIKGF